MDTESKSLDPCKPIPQITEIYLCLILLDLAYRYLNQNGMTQAT